MSAIAALLRHDLPQDAIEQDRIAQRRAAEAARKERIFNPRQRTMGLDLPVLDKQVEEHHAREQREREEQLAYDAYAAQNAKTLHILDLQRERSRVGDARSVDAFRQQQQQPQTRREYDLNDPLALRNAAPIRADDHCPVSSLQQFTGEDLAQKQRQHEQQEQMKVWNWQVAQQREAERRRAADAQRTADETLMRVDSARVRLAKEEERRRREEATRTAQYNQQLVFSFFSICVLMREENKTE